MDNGFPEISQSFLIGQDIFYTQFNEIEFYVEDINQENFYFSVLRKLFPEISFEKIFPLGGKPNVIAACEQEIGNKKKIYLLDLDFDEIFQRKKNHPNLFYLERYSIENYLLQEDCYLEIISEEKPHLRKSDIKNRFQLQDLLHESLSLFADLVPNFLVIQEHGLAIKNVDYDIVYFLDLRVAATLFREPVIRKYREDIQTALTCIDNRLILETEIDKYRHLYSSPIGALSVTPGKYLINFLKGKIECIFDTARIELKSFAYRIAKLSTFSELEYLKIAISDYLI